MNKRTKIALSIAIISLVISGVIFLYFKLDSLPPIFDRFRTKKIGLETTEVTFLNNHPTLTVSLSDKNKIDQIVRLYPETFPNRFQKLEIITTQEQQESMFAWDSGNTFGYTIKSDFANKSLIISFYIGAETLKNENWSNEKIARNLEYYLVHALEREKIAHEAQYSVTRSIEEETERNAVVESRVDEVVGQLNTDNDTNVFEIK